MGGAASYFEAHFAWIFWARNSPLAAYSPYARRSYRAAWREAQPFPYPNRYLDETRIQMWRQIFEQLKGADAMGELKTVLNRHIQSLPEDQTVFSQLARACFWWWNGERGDAAAGVARKLIAIRL